MLLAVFVIFGACGTTEATTDGGDADTSRGVGSAVLPGQTGDENASSSVPETTVDGPDVSVTNGPDVDDSAPPDTDETTLSGPSVAPGAAVLAERGFSDFFGLRVGLIANRASVVDGRSVIDILAEADGFDLVAVFAPEHGLRADAGAGELVADGVDPVTGLPVYSLYGETRSPTQESLAGMDVLVHDLQDVGARFYTYTATMGLAMQAAAEAGIPFVVLDRPNPIGDRAAGSMRADDQVSFVSRYPVPALHGMTSGELAIAIQGEGWLDGLADLDLRVVPMAGWRSDMRWSDTGLDWTPPSPGLPTAESALTYPATVLFEATTLSYGRGTDHPFQQIGAPWLDSAALAEALRAADLAGVRFDPVAFTPEADERAAALQYEGVEVSGVRVIVTDGSAVDQAAVGVHLLAAVLAQAQAVNDSGANGSAGEDGSADEPAIQVIDRPEFLALLTGTTAVGDALAAGVAPADIVASWSDELSAFEELRSRYRLYGP